MHDSNTPPIYGADLAPRTGAGSNSRRIIENICLVVGIQNRSHCKARHAHSRAFANQRQRRSAAVSTGTDRIGQTYIP
jgi:hypothetical protein